MKYGSCPRDQQLSLLVSGGLSEQDSDLIFEHVEHCSACTERVVQLPEDKHLVDSIQRASRKFTISPDDRESIGRIIERLQQLPRLPVEGASWSEFGSKLDELRDGAISKASSTPHSLSTKDLLQAIQSHLLPATTPSEIGRLGSYQILGVLGYGGMGVVLEGFDTQLARKVAIKTLHPKLLNHPTSRARFLREARAVAAMEHDHIVSIYQVGEENDLPYFVMPLLKGESLEQRLHRSPDLTIAEILDIASQMLQGLAAAHAQNLIHRDIKPANVWLEDRGTAYPMEASRLRVRLLDFGLVQNTDGDKAIKGAATIAGTPAFMAPEQAVGLEADARSDLFSFGCVLYRLLSGQLPFRGRNHVSQFLSILENKPIHLRELNPLVPMPLEELIVQLLEKEPANRPNSADQLLVELREIQANELQREATAPEVVSGDLSNSNRRLANMQRDANRTASGNTKVVRWLAGGLLVALTIAIAFWWVRLPQSRLADQHPSGHLLPKDRAPNGVESGVPTVAPEMVRTMPGLVPSPEARAGYRRWQIETKLPRGEVFSVAWDGDGKRIAVSSVHGFVRILKADSSELEQIVPAHFGNVWSVDWSRDATMLATGGEDGKVQLFSADGAWRRSLGSHAGLVRTVGISNDGEWIASAGSDSTIQVWRADGGASSQFKGHFSQVDALAWHPSSKRLASAAWDNTVRIWNVESGVSQAIPLTKNNVLSLAWNPRGDRLAAGGVDGVVRIFDDRGEEVARTMDHGTMVTAMGWSSHNILVTGDQNGRVRFWDDETQLFKTVDLGPSRINALRWTQDGQRLAVVCDKVRFLDSSAETVGALEHTTSALRSVEWNRADQLATTGDDSCLRIWSMDGTQTQRLPNRSVRPSVHWNPAGDQLVTAGWGQTVDVCDTQGNKLYEFVGNDPVAWNPTNESIAWSLGKEVLIGEKGATKHTLRGHKSSVQGLAWNADGTLLASADGMGEIRIWRSDGTEDEIIHSDMARIAWNPKHSILASGGTGHGTIGLWSAAGQLQTSWRAQIKGILDLEWSPDGERLLSTSYDYTAQRIWKRNGLPAGVLGGTLSVASSASWSRTGHRIATAHIDGTLRCWDGQTLEPLWTSLVFDDGAWVRFSTTGVMQFVDASIEDARLVVVGEDGEGNLKMLNPSLAFP